MSALWNYERYRINASSLKQDLLWPPAEQSLMDAFMPKGIIPLDYNSRTKSRKILERMAKQFRREFHYDFTQFACEEDMCSYRNPLIDGPIGLLF